MVFELIDPGLCQSSSPISLSFLSFPDFQVPPSWSQILTRITCFFPENFLWIPSNQPPAEAIHPPCLSQQIHHHSTISYSDLTNQYRITHKGSHTSTISLTRYLRSETIGAPYHEIWHPSRVWFRPEKSWFLQGNLAFWTLDHFWEAHRSWQEVIHCIISRQSGRPISWQNQILMGSHPF